MGKAYLGRDPHFWPISTSHPARPIPLPSHFLLFCHTYVRGPLCQLPTLLPCPISAHAWMNRCCVGPTCQNHLPHVTNYGGLRVYAGKSCSQVWTRGTQQTPRAYRR
jgi:hypothetical protein